MIGAILNIIGYYLVARLIWAIWRIIEEIFIIKEKDLAARYGEGSWAFITGSTDGIGLEFGVQLARRGFNIILVARNPEKLLEKEALIKRENPKVQVKRVVFDFTDSAVPGALDKVLAEVRGLDISIVINNVGMGTNNTPTLDMPMKNALDMVLVNTIPQAVFDRHLLPLLQSRPKRSALIDVSSVTAIVTLPGKELYAATKYFNKALNISHSMAADGDKVDFLALKPGFVSTNLTDNRKADIITVDTTKCVLGTLKALGNRKVTFGATAHILFGSLIQFVTFVVPIDFIMKYRKQIYSLLKYDAFKNAKVAQ